MTSNEHNLNVTPTILIVDDDKALVEALGDWLLDEGYRVKRAANGYEGLQKARKCQPDLVLADINMPIMSGVEMARYLLDEGFKIIFVSGQPSRPRDLQSIPLVSKPFDLDHIERLIKQAVGPAFP